MLPAVLVYHHHLHSEQGTMRASCFVVQDHSFGFRLLFTSYRTPTKRTRKKPTLLVVSCASSHNYSTAIVVLSKYLIASQWCFGEARRICDMYGIIVWHSKNLARSL